MRYLIVNGDDFGASGGVNRGILDAHHRGILTSASLMVDMPGSREAARLAREAPELSVGLHVDLARPGAGAAPDLDDAEACDAELDRQAARFRELLGRPPTHLDSHRNVHRRPALRPRFVAFARRHGLPLREHSAARYFPSFYGRWSGESHPEQVSAEALARMLRDEIGDGVTELGCHPGYADGELRSEYAAERELELRTLCDPAVRPLLAQLGYRLIGFRELAGASGGPPG
jgi:predicted glycoside hydrolase/deacetylase ChbG (UPF0249 family)